MCVWRGSTSLAQARRAKPRAVGHAGRGAGLRATASPPLTSKGSGSLGSARDPTTPPSCTWLFISPSCCLTCKEEEQRGWLGYAPPSTALHKELWSSLGSLCASTQGEMARRN